MLTEGRNRSAAVLIAWLMTSTLLSAKKKKEGGRPGRYYLIPSGLVLYMCPHTTNEWSLPLPAVNILLSHRCQERIHQSRQVPREQRHVILTTPASAYYYMCLHTTIYVSLYYYVCVVVRL